MKHLILLMLFFIVGMVLASASQELATKVPDLAQLQKMTARFAPTELNVDISNLSDGDRRALVKLMEAARLIDDIFMTQYWSGDLRALRQAAEGYVSAGQGAPALLLDQQKSVVGARRQHRVPSRRARTQAAGRELLSRVDDQGAVRKLGEDAARRPAEAGDGLLHRHSLGWARHGFKIVPYSEAYKEDLTRAAKLLNEAPSLTDNATLKRFLTTRAAAFLSNDYYESDVAWMDLDAPLDITIGPYETYNDELFGYKASYEAYVNVRDEEESAKLGAFAKNLQEIENNLPHRSQVSQSEDRRAGAHSRGE